MSHALRERQQIFIAGTLPQDILQDRHARNVQYIVHIFKPEPHFLVNADFTATYAVATDRTKYGLAAPAENRE
jgi:hypothetical protein